jgi:formamidase
MNSANSPRWSISIDRETPLSSQPDKGHNRWHPEIPPVLTVAEGDVVELETRDVADGQIGRRARTGELTQLDSTRTAPLTGPVHIAGAETGDLLCIEVLSVAPQGFGFTICSSRYGIIKHHVTEALIARWDIENGFATSADIPYVRIPGAPFMGIMGVAPSHSLMDHYTAKELTLSRDGWALPPIEPNGAVPMAARNGLRTLPPRSNGGNMDIRQLTAGSVLRLPVYVPGALFSTGDAHFAQGDNECCTGIEMGATLRCRFTLKKGLAHDRGIRRPQVFRERPGAETRSSAIFCTTGMSSWDADDLGHDDLNRAAEEALLNMIDHLQHEYGYTFAQAATICSVAVDLKVSQAANTPNYLITAVLPLDIFLKA